MGGLKVLIINAGLLEEVVKVVCFIKKLNNVYSTKSS
jgi:hypothetical protein